MAIASNIRPGDDPVEVSKKLVGQTRTQLMKDLFAYFDIPANIIHHVFGNLYARDVLTQRERELCAVAALCVLNRANELKSHIIAAIRTGATKAEVAEVILQISLSTGLTFRFLISEHDLLTTLAGPSPHPSWISID